VREHPSHQEINRKSPYVRGSAGRLRPARRSLPGTAAGPPTSRRYHGQGPPAPTTRPRPERRCAALRGSRSHVRGGRLPVFGSTAGSLPGRGLPCRTPTRGRRRPTTAPTPRNLSTAGSPPAPPKTRSVSASAPESPRGSVTRDMPPPHLTTLPSRARIAQAQRLCPPPGGHARSGAHLGLEGTVSAGAAILTSQRSRGLVGANHSSPASARSTPRRPTARPNLAPPGLHAGRGLARKWQIQQPPQAHHVSPTNDPRCCPSHRGASRETERTGARTCAGCVINVPNQGSPTPHTHRRSDQLNYPSHTRLLTTTSTDIPGSAPYDSWPALHSVDQGLMTALISRAHAAGPRRSRPRCSTPSRADPAGVCGVLGPRVHPAPASQPSHITPAASPAAGPAPSEGGSGGNVLPGSRPLRYMTPVGDRRADAPLVCPHRLDSTVSKSWNRCAVGRFDQVHHDVRCGWSARTRRALRGNINRVFVNLSRGARPWV